MIICQACIADTSATLFAVSSLDPEERISYTLLLHDLPTGEKEEIVFQYENNAIRTFAAWLAADEPNLGVLQANLDELRRRVKSNKFLP